MADESIWGILLDGGAYEIIGRRVSMTQLAARLEKAAREPVWDRTNLTGRYSFSFRFARDLTADADSPSPYPLLPAAIKESLGLELKKQKGALTTIVVNQIERPTEN